MRMRDAVMATVLVMAVGSPARAQDPEATYKAMGKRASAPLVTIPYGADPLQVADLRVPSGKGPFPVAVIIHGGCWRASVDKRGSIAGLADALGRRGFATWNIEYRHIGEPPAANHFDVVTPGTPNGEAVADFIAAKALTAHGR